VDLPVGIDHGPELFDDIGPLIAVHLPFQDTGKPVKIDRFIVCIGGISDQLGHVGLRQVIGGRQGALQQFAFILADSAVDGHAMDHQRRDREPGVIGIEMVGGRRFPGQLVQK